MNPLFRVILWPFSALYNLIMSFRNYLYDIGYKKSFRFQTTVISVGNLSMGGNGKTPMVEYLIRLLKPKYQIAVLSRGYGRSSSGFKLAQSTDSAVDIGDEPLQMYRKFSPEIEVAVGESRALAIPKILLEKPQVEVIILDDAFQHREVDPQFSILVTDYHSPFFEDYVVPSGMLRESRKGVSRANAVVVTKCPQDITFDQRKHYQSQIEAYHKLPVFFTAIKYQQPVSLATGATLTECPSVFLVTGIAKPEPMVDFVSKQFTLVEHLRFKDHHHFHRKQVLEIRQQFERFSGNPAILLTTEKDMVRLAPHKAELKDLPVYYLPIECVFVEDQDRFNSLILNNIESD